MIFPSYNKWIILSLSDYIQTYFGSVDYVWFQGMLRPKNEPTQRYEIRYLGPDIISQTQDMDTIHIAVNCQITTVKTPGDIESHLIRVGNAQTMLRQCISVYRLGSDPVMDTKTLLGNLQQISNVETTSFGTVDPVSSAERSTVEVTYKIVI